MRLAGPYWNFQCVIDEKPWGKVIPVYVHLVFYFVESLAKNRSRRQKVDKKGKFAAFEKLKKAKASGEKNKYEVYIYIYLFRFYQCSVHMSVSMLG